MNCPWCKHDRSRVTDKRNLDHETIYRRRQCGKCLKRWNTYEIADPEAQRAGPQPKGKSGALNNPETSTTGA